MVPSSNLIGIIILGVYPVTVVIALALLERGGEYGHGNEHFFGAVLWPLLTVVIPPILIYQHFKHTHKYENNLINRFTEYF